MKEAFATVYRFMYPQHFDFLMSQGMFVRWTPDWAVVRSSIKISKRG